jgi:hypothetical protein
VKNLVATSNRRANAVATLPAEVCGLTLSLLDLTNNELTTLPPRLGTMTTLRRLVLDGNPLRALPHSVLAGPTTKLLESLRKKMPEEEGDARGATAAAVRSGNVFGEDERHHAVAAAQRVASAAAPSSLSLAGGCRRPRALCIYSFRVLRRLSRYPTKPFPPNVCSSHVH